MLAAITAEIIETATITYQRPGFIPQTYLTMVLNSAKITSVEIQGDLSNARGTESVTLSPESVDITYVP